MLERFEDRMVPSITGHVYYDVDGGGSDNGDIDASGVSVLLFQGGVPVGGTSTDSSGNYFFPNTPGVGDYVQVFPYYSQFAYSNAGSTNNIPVSGGGTADLGLRGFANEAGGQGTIAGQLWFDTDGDTTKDTGETTGPDGAMVELLFTDQSSATFTLGYVMSSSGGQYAFGNLWSGSSYKLHVGGPVPGGGTPFAVDTPASAPATGTTTTDVGVTLPVITVEKISDGTEGGGDALFRFTRTGDTSGSLTVNFSAGGTATGSGTDYSLMGTSVTFSGGSSTADVWATVNNDGASEPTETVSLTVLSGGNDYRVGSPSSASANILDNDAQYVSVSQLADVVEGAATGKFRFTRTGDLSSSLAVDYTVGGTAISGADFTALSGSATIPAGQPSVDVTVSALEDQLLEGSETVTVTVASGTGYTPSGSPASLTVIDKIYGDTFDWNGVATVQVLVTYDAPGHTGEYLWNYHVTNDSFASGIANFALPTEDVGLVSSQGNTLGWSNSIGTFQSDSDLIAWESGGSTLAMGNSADFWFTTAPTGLGLTSGFLTDAGLTTFPGGLLVTAMAAAPALPLAPLPAVLVTTNNDVVDRYDDVFSLREAVAYTNGLQNTPQPRVAFTASLGGTTITLNPNPSSYGQLELSKDVYIDGPLGGITIKRDSTAIQKHRIFNMLANTVVTLEDLTLRNGKVDDAGGAVQSRGYLTIVNCSFIQNEATGSRGGAIAALQGTLTVTGSLFTGNTAMYGGAIYLGERVATTISSSSLTLNTATESGGGLYISSSSTNDPTLVTLTGVDVNGNSAVLLGGGICAQSTAGGSGTSLTLNGGTTVQNNQVTGASGKGGGIYFGKGTLTLGANVVVNTTTNTATTGPSIYRLNTGTTLTIVPGTTPTYADVTGP